MLGRLSSDAVTTLGAGVDGSVRRREYKYDTQGNNYLITSFDAASAGNIVNQVQRVYNGLRQLTGEYQSHSGAVNTSSTPQVQYAYTEMSGGQNNSRLVSLTYPSGYVLNFNYNTGLDSNISRLSSISDSANTLESYKYLGLNTVVERDHPQNNVNLTYIQQAGDPNAITDGGDQYTGLDRFGRVIDQNWIKGSTSTDRFQMGYDQDSDVLYRQNLVDSVMSELYAYDNLNQLTSFQRGTLNSTHNGIVGTPSRSQSWSPDALGNFTSVTTNGTAQTRTANQQNEITSISGQGTPTYDANGNLTADGSGNTYVYDAWNQLVAVKNGTTTLAAYGYDGLHRRITETHGATTTDLYYSAAWQVLEERVGGVVQARNVWSPVYIDALVLRDQSSLHNGVLDQRLYVQQDANWNVTALVDTSGNVLERYDYDPYGAVTVLNPDFSLRGTSSYGWLYFFQGKRYDSTVGLYDSRERVYSPTLMRPLQADPLGLGPDNNYYRWERNGPTDALDPSGMDYYGGLSGGGGLMGGGFSGYPRPPMGGYGGYGGGGLMGLQGMQAPVRPSGPGTPIGGFGPYGGGPGPLGNVGNPYPPPPPQYAGPPAPYTGPSGEQVLEDLFYYPIESLRIAGDLIRAAQAGIYIWWTGKPWEPDYRSDAAKSVPPQFDREASAQWMKQWQLWNIKNGGEIAAMMAAGKLGATLREMTAAERRAYFIAKGVPESQIGPSGYPKVHIVETVTLKEAEEAARRAGSRKPIKHTQDRGQPTHFHPVDAQGNKLTGSKNIHFQKRGECPNPE